MLNIEAKSSTAAIKSTDFAYRGKGGDAQLARQRHHRPWSAGELRHVIAALQQTPVIITVDQRTGHTLIGVKLIRLDSSPSVSNGVLIEYADGTRLVHRIEKIGETIIPLVQTEAKWVALESMRQEKAAAEPLFLEKMGGIKPTYTGKREVRVTAKGVTISYQPSWDREQQAAEPVAYRRYVWREMTEAELGVLA